MKLANARVNFDIGISCFKALHMFRTCFFSNTTVKLQAKICVSFFYIWCTPDLQNRLTLWKTDVTTIKIGSSAFRILQTIVLNIFALIMIVYNGIKNKTLKCKT